MFLMVIKVNLKLTFVTFYGTRRRLTITDQIGHLMSHHSVAEKGGTYAFGNFTLHLSEKQQKKSLERTWYYHN